MVTMDKPLGPGAFHPDQSRENKRRPDWRLVSIGVVAALSFALLLAQLWRLQIVEGGSFRQLADINRFRVSPVAAPRGIVYDRNHQIVAANTPSFQVAVVPAALPQDKAELDRVYQELGSLLGMPASDIADKVSKRKGDDFTPVGIKSDVERDIMLMVEEKHLRLPGAVVVPQSSRLYPYGSLMSHILGYMLPITEEQLAAKQADNAAGYKAEDEIGAAGVEATYEGLLRGKPGQKLFEVDANERPINDLRIDNPDPGKNLTLTIDVNLQRDVEQILRDGMGESESAVAIVMNPNDGEVLAMVSLPSYDDNVFSSSTRSSEIEALLTDPLKPMLDYAIGGTFPAGSTYKLVTAAAALQEGVANANTQITCNGALYIPNAYNPSLSTRLPCWGVHGKENFVQGIANSCDVYFYTLGGGFKDFKGVGAEGLAHYAEMLGYGAPTGIDLPGEVSGLVPTPEWKQDTWGEPWVTGDTYNMSIGQGFVLVTPMQVANVTNTIANGGKLFWPRVGMALSDAEDKPIRSIDPVEARQVAIDPANLELIRTGMKAVMEVDPVAQMNVPELKIAGKTGTAEYPGPKDANGIMPTHGWFTGFAPYDDPQVSVTVFVQKGGGPSNAVPIGMKIFRRYFNYPEPTPTPTRAPSRAQ